MIYYESTFIHAIKYKVDRVFIWQIPPKMIIKWVMFPKLLYKT